MASALGLDFTSARPPRPSPPRSRARQGTPHHPRIARRRRPPAAPFVSRPAPKRPGRQMEHERVGLRREGAAVQLRALSAISKAIPSPAAAAVAAPVGPQRALRIGKRVAGPVDAHLGRHSPAAGIDAHRAEPAARAAPSPSAPVRFRSRRQAAAARFDVRFDVCIRSQRRSDRGRLHQLDHLARLLVQTKRPSRCATPRASPRGAREAAPPGVRALHVPGIAGSPFSRRRPASRRTLMLVSASSARARRREETILAAFALGAASTAAARVSKAAAVAGRALCPELEREGPPFAPGGRGARPRSLRHSTRPVSTPRAASSCEQGSPSQAQHLQARGRAR